MRVAIPRVGVDDPEGFDGVHTESAYRGHVDRVIRREPASQVERPVEGIVPHSLQALDVALAVGHLKLVRSAPCVEHDGGREDVLRVRVIQHRENTDELAAQAITIDAATAAMRISRLTDVMSIPQETAATAIQNRAERDMYRLWAPSPSKKAARDDAISPQARIA